jgi:type VI secretion system secreted protein VgrG
MPGEFTQQSSPMRFKSAGLGPDDLLLASLSGREDLSALFAFELELLAPVAAPVSFDAVLGTAAAVELDLPGGGLRYFQGIVSRFAQGGRDERFITYRAALVPHAWLLTKQVQSRIFQHVSVPDILKKVLVGFPVTYRLQGRFHPRDYCVQYRESDFAFASRLMEEEGIYYYFAHTAGGDQMVVANTPQGHDDMPDPAAVNYDELAGGNRGGGDDESRVFGWVKVQEVRAGRVTLWDHTFELPHKNLEADQKIQDSVTVGTVTHKLGLPAATGLELYDFPGGYAGRFDGVNAGGADQEAELQKIFEDNRRTARLRIQEEAAGAVSIDGGGVCRQMTAGHKFTLARHFDADGDYVLTRVEHRAGFTDGGYRSGGTAFAYENRFACVPAALPFLPPRVTPRPTVKGTQTAVVVGPAGEEIFTDKYGRIKVQFHWDRQGKHDADSSCWVRVGTIWAGQTWGVIHIPRIGQEVVVDYLEGDPDQPIVIGSVYNADQMPPGKLPKDAMVSGLQSRSTPKGGPSNFNGMRANDTKGKEGLTVQAEYDMTTLVKHDDAQTVKNDRTITVDGNHTETIKKDCTLTVDGKHTETIKKDTSIAVTEGNYSHDVVKGTSFAHVKGAVTENYDASQETIVKEGIHIASTTAHIYIHTATSIQLHVGDSSIWMDSGGQIAIKGNNVMIEGKESVTIHGGMVRSAADSSHETAGGNIKSEAKSNNVVKGAMVMLNPG